MVEGRYYCELIICDIRSVANSYRIALALVFICLCNYEKMHDCRYVWVMRTNYGYKYKHISNRYMLLCINKMHIHIMTNINHQGYRFNNLWRIFCRNLCFHSRAQAHINVTSHQHKEWRWASTWCYSKHIKCHYPAYFTAESRILNPKFKTTNVH